MNSKQRKILEAIFANPINASISWSDIESVFRAYGGTIKEGRGSRSWFIWETRLPFFTDRTHNQQPTKAQ